MPWKDYWLERKPSQQSFTAACKAFFIPFYFPEGKYRASSWFPYLVDSSSELKPYKVRVGLTKVPLPSQENRIIFRNH